MEYWSYPPKYDPGYMPEPSSRYWFPVRETMPAGELQLVCLDVFVIEDLVLQI